MLWYKILGRTDGNIATKKGVLTIEKRPLFWETGRAVLAGNAALKKKGEIIRSGRLLENASGISRNH